ncbi:MAG TPA: uracil-DNA glycosylase [Polaromonas sp.]|nr:uracil-DNA glycosylase [Polaromonas sp.]HYW55611.1 uracil-DNA glycosylase [Polaromonas sp.]
MDLDKRQRAMLREMGVRVWQPQPAASEAAATQAANAINTIANAARPQGAEARFDSKPPVMAPQTAPAGVSVPPPLQDVSAPRDILGIERMDWPALQAAVAGCTACALCQGRKNTVFGVGPLAPVDWLIVGEAPGENEDLAGEPFVGQAGKLLDNMLQAMRLQRGNDNAVPKAGVSKSVFITNVLKCRPPANRNPEPSEVAQCAPYLKRQVELLQPKMILALGKFAAHSLLQASVPEVEKIPLGKLRGQVHRYLGVPVVVTYHPAYLLRSLPDKAKAWDDMCLALSVAPTIVRSA